MYHEYHRVLPHYTRSRGSVQSADQRCAQNYLSATPLFSLKTKNLRCIEVDRSLLEDTIMSVSIFVDLQDFLVGRHFVVKEFALKDGFELSHYIIGCSVWSSLTKAETHQTMWLIENRHGIQWENGIIPYGMAKSLITKSVMTYNDDWWRWWNCRVRQETWETSMVAGFAPGWSEIGSYVEGVYVENIEAHYEDIESLNKLDVTHILHCQKQNCVL